MLKEYLDLAIYAGLLDEAVRSRTLTTTAKGKSFLEEYAAVKRLVEEDSMAEESDLGDGILLPDLSQA